MVCLEIAEGIAIGKPSAFVCFHGADIVPPDPNLAVLRLRNGFSSEEIPLFQFFNCFHNDSPFNSSAISGKPPRPVKACRIAGVPPRRAAGQE